jgi:hypothetical protein
MNRPIACSGWRRSWLAAARKRARDSAACSASAMRCSATAVASRTRSSLIWRLCCSRSASRSMSCASTASSCVPRVPPATTSQRASKCPASSAATVRDTRRSGRATVRAMWRTEAQAASNATSAMPMPAMQRAAALARVGGGVAEGLHQADGRVAGRGGARGREGTGARGLAQRDRRGEHAQLRERCGLGPGRDVHTGAVADLDARHLAAAQRGVGHVLQAGRSPA